MFVYKEYLTAMSWNTSCGNLKEVSHKHLKSAAAWGCFGDAVMKEKVPPQGDRQREREQQRRIRLSTERLAVQLLSAAGWWAHISTNQYTLRAAETGRCDATLSAIPQFWQIQITCTLHTLWMWVTHWNMTASLMYHLVCQVVFILCTKKAILTLLHACGSLCPRAFSFLTETLNIDYLALVDPVDIETFRIHLHGDRTGLCGVLDEDKGIDHHKRLRQGCVKRSCSMMLCSG